MKKGGLESLIVGSLILLIIFSLMSIFLLPMLSAADLSRGKILYDAHCAACHGVLGDGNGPKAADFTPRPTNFTSATVMANIPFDINEQVVAQGKPGTGMPGFAMVLSPEEVQDVIAYQRAFPKQ